VIKRLDDIEQALRELRAGLVLAYPTEAVYGLGCDPFQPDSVARIVTLKGRSLDKGLILLISKWSQLFSLIGDVPPARLDVVKKTWPGPVTWVFPKSATVPDYLCGSHDTIAVRMTAHPVAQQLCQFDPIVSTSANPQGKEPARSLQALEHFFPKGVDGVVMGALGVENQPSAIYDALTDERLR